MYVIVVFEPSLHYIYTTIISALCNFFIWDDYLSLLKFILLTVNWQVFNHDDIPRQAEQLLPVPAFCFVFFPPVLRFASAFFVTQLDITACGPISGTEKPLRAESSFIARQG